MIIVAHVFQKFIVKKQNDIWLCFSHLSLFFSLIFLGFLCGKKKLFDEKHIECFELFLFKIAIPCSLFCATLHHKLRDLINLSYIFSYLVCFSIVAIIIAFYFRKSDSSSQICIKVFASGYINAAIYSLPVITILTGDPKAGIISNILQIVLIQPILVSIMVMHLHHEKTLLNKLYLSLFNPLIITPIAGLFINYFHINLHAIIITPITHLGSGAFSIALFTFGLNFSKFRINKKIFTKELLFILLMKNIMHPLVGLIIGHYVFCLEKYWLISLLICTSAPTAYIVYLLSKKFLIEQELIKSIVAISSIVSLLSLIIIARLI